MVYIPTPGPPKVAYHRYLTDAQGMPLGVIRLLPERCRVCAIRGQLGVIYDDPNGRYEQVQCLTCDYGITRPKRDDPGRRMNQGAQAVVAQAQEAAQRAAQAQAAAQGAVLAPGFLPPPPAAPLAQPMPPQLPPVPPGYPMPGPNFAPQPQPQPTAGGPGQPWPPPGWPPNVG